MNNFQLIWMSLLVLILVVNRNIVMKFLAINVLVAFFLINLNILEIIESEYKFSIVLMVLIFEILTFFFLKKNLKEINRIDLLGLNE